MNGISPELRVFLQGVFGDRADEAWLAAFRDFPPKPGDWTGKRAGDWAGMDPEAALNEFFCISLMKPGAGARREANIEGHWLIVADDIGTKASREDWERLIGAGFPPPSFKIETSPGNETWGWLLRAMVPLGSKQEADVRQVRALMAARGLSDAAVVVDPTRYIRLPGGWNSKPKYALEGGGFPWVSAVELELGRRADLEDMGRALAGENWRTEVLPLALTPGKKLGGAGGDLDRSADMNAPEPIIQLAQEVGMAPVQIRQGVVEARCPNADQHTDGRPDGFAFLGAGIMHCQHDHCSSLTTMDFRRMICEAFDDQEAVRAAAGAAVGVTVAPRVANDFLAVADFAQHGGLGPVAEDEVSGLAEAMAGRVVAARLKAEQDFDAAVGDLAKRFVYVRSADVFFDLQERAVIARSVIDTHEEVRAVIPFGSNGAKKAVNVLMNHPDLMTAATFTYAPGALGVLVKTRNESGVDVSAANLWTPTRIGRRKGEPTKWLELVRHIIPAENARNAFLDWMAWVVQNPDKRTPIIPLLIGDQGTGKDTMITPLIQIIGAHNVSTVNAADMRSGFNGWMRRRLVVFDELKLSGDDLYNQIKAWTGSHETLVAINTKFERVWYMIPVSVFIAMSNHDDALQGAEADDRRWMPYKSPAVKMPPEWYAAMKDAVGSVDELERVHEFFMARDVSQWNAYGEAPNFDKAEVLADGLNSPTRFCYVALTEGVFANRTLVTLKEVEDYAAAFGHASVKNRINSKHVQDALKHAGCQSLGRQIRVGGQIVRLWHGPKTKGRTDLRTFMDGMEPSVVSAMFVKEAEGALGIA